MTEYSKKFCVNPWVQQQTTPSGRVNFCCVSANTWVSDEEGQPIELKEDSLRKAWNSKDMRAIRRDMIEGKAVRGCEVCYEQERVGKKSYRQHSNEEWFWKLKPKVLRARIEKSKHEDFHVEDYPDYLDLRLGNLCNLKCRTCNPTNSTQIDREWKKIDAQTNHDHSRFWKKYNITRAPIDNWYESDQFWHSVEENLPYLKKIYMTGGEPTLIRRNLEFLRRCKELGYASKIEIFFSLNLTKIEDDFLECLQGFRKVRINGSIDGYGTVNDYIRFPSRWKDIDSNLRKLASLDGLPLEIGTSTVIQPYNILNLPKLFGYLEDVNRQSRNKVLIDSLFCTHPDFLDIIHFPPQLKAVALKQLKEYRSQSRLYRSISKNGLFFRNSLDSTIKRLESGLHSQDADLVRDFQNYTVKLDRFRKQDFSKVFPETAAILSEVGFSFS